MDHLVGITSTFLYRFSPGLPQFGFKLHIPSMHLLPENPADPGEPFALKVVGRAAQDILAQTSSRSSLAQLYPDNAIKLLRGRGLRWNLDVEFASERTAVFTPGFSLQGEASASIPPGGFKFSFLIAVSFPLPDIGQPESELQAFKDDPLAMLASGGITLGATVQLPHGLPRVTLTGTLTAEKVLLEVSGMPLSSCGHSKPCNTVSPHPAQQPFIPPSQSEPQSEYMNTAPILRPIPARSYIAAGTKKLLVPLFCEP